MYSDFLASLVSLLNFALKIISIFKFIGKPIGALEDNKEKYLYDLRVGKTLLNKT